MSRPRLRVIAGEGLGRSDVDVEANSQSQRTKRTSISVPFSAHMSRIDYSLEYVVSNLFGSNAAAKGYLLSSTLPNQGGEVKEKVQSTSQPRYQIWSVRDRVDHLADQQSSLDIFQGRHHRWFVIHLDVPVGVGDSLDLSLNRKP